MENVGLHVHHRLHRESKNVSNILSIIMFARYWLIFKILSLAHSCNFSTECANERSFKIGRQYPWQTTKHTVVCQPHTVSYRWMWSVESTGALGQDATDFLHELDGRIAAATGDPRSSEFLFQRLSVAIQRGNAACVLYWELQWRFLFCLIGPNSY